MPSFIDIHHLKLAVSDLDRSRDFYAEALGAWRIPEYDHLRDGVLFAYILEVPNFGTTLELRLDPEAAAAQSGFNFLTLSVADRAALAEWERHLDTIGARRSPVLVGGLGWLVAFDDPDGKQIRLYTRESHGPEIEVSWDSPWIT